MNQIKILWLNWFVEAPFLWCSSQIVAIHHGIHPPSSGQLQQLRKGSFLYPACRYFQQSHLIFNGEFSSFPQILTVDWSTATVMKGTSPLFSILLFSNPKSFWTVRCRRFLINNSMVNFTDFCRIRGIVSVNDSWLPSWLQEVVFHHGSLSCQILLHGSVSVTVSRFTSLN